MVGLEQIMQARERIAQFLYKSPCARSEHFSERCGCTAFFKLENLQRTGSFKERGALNRILLLDEEERGRGLICASAGNHAQALAYHAGARGIPAVVVMPRRTPLIKVTNTRAHGADVRLVGESFDEALEHARELEQEHGYVFVPPFEDPDIIAGQGTIALELMEQREELEVLVVPVGGGGLISGIAAAYKSLRPAVRIVGVETEVQASMKASREQGEIVALERDYTIADGIAVKRPGELTLEMVTKHVDELVTVDEEEIANAILLLLEREKAVAEGAGAVGLAALYNGHIDDIGGKNVCMVLSGGNIDVNLLSRIIERGLAKDGRIVQVEVTVEDRPGALAQLLALVAKAEANVLEVHHQRALGSAELGEVVVELTLETRGMEHLRELAEQVRAAGFTIALAARHDRGPSRTHTD